MKNDRTFVESIANGISDDRLKVLSPDHWDWWCRHFPEIAVVMLHEYRRCDGFLPYERGYVYMMQAVGSRYFKIGKSINPDRRLLQISPKMPFETRLVKVWRSNFMSLGERCLHDAFQEKRRNGEWFELSDWDCVDLLYAGFFCERVRNPYGGIFLDICGVEYSRFNKLSAWIPFHSSAELTAFADSIFNQIAKRCEDDVLAAVQEDVTRNWQQAVVQESEL